jgi:CheY-like chemotaxis protein
MTIEDPIVLLVDDSEDDALLMHAIVGRAGFVESLRVVRNGGEAIAYLRGDGVYCNRKLFPLPTAVLLDLKMPRESGFEVLAWMRQQPAFRHLHIYILTASSRPEDIQQAYALGANSYLVKPANLDGLIHLAKCLLAWLKLSHFAHAAEAGADHAFAMLGAEGVRMQHAGTG